MKKGKLIVVEGACDGIGKTTQYKMLCDHLKDDGISVVNHHFPSYGTSEGALVERYLKGEFGEVSKLSPYFVNSLYAVDRAVTWNTNLGKLYDDENTIVLDRYTTSSLIYQSALIDDIDEKKKFIDYVSDFEYNKIGIKKPDNVIFLSAPFELVTKLRMDRKENEGITSDIHESDLNFMKKVYDNALFVANYLSWNVIECSSDGGMRDIPDIHNEIYRLVKK